MAYPRLIVTALFALATPAFCQLTVRGFGGVSASLAASGAWSVSAPGPGWGFGGSLGTKAVASYIDSGTDNLGGYQELAFSYTISGGSRSASIRVYAGRPIVLFAVTYTNAAANASPFPAFTSYPALSHLTFEGEFSQADFTDFNGDSPWVYFDGSANTFVLSPASDYMTAATVKNGNAIATGISAQIANLPARLTHKTVLVFGQGINQTLRQWGQALTDLSGKRRPANDADTLLRKISYWTDNGATYYYNPGGPSYPATLEAIKAEFDAKGIALGSMQLDSWWYPKGPDDNWSSTSGIWTYTASPALFPDDLAPFQAALGVPLVTHARWIDVNSPYRTEYTISGNVATDPRYWEDVGNYLQAAGVTTYEQDWLGNNAQTLFNLTDPSAFMGNMAASMAKRGITLQYCMGTPHHFLESTKYGNATTVRSSQDRFGESRWSNFLYSSAFASAVGVWPFADVFLSQETNNLILAALSGGPVGVGDPMGSIARGNLLKTVRSDGVIVKPDAPATPLDSVIMADAQGVDVPMVASTYSDFGGGMRANYIFAFPRATNTTVMIDPSVYGITGAAWLQDYLNNTGWLIGPGSTYTLNLTGEAGYFVLAPVGPSGIALLGDQGHFVTMGKQRIAGVADDGKVDVTVSFAAGETVRTLFGYAPGPVMARAVAGSVGAPVWDATTQMFEVRVHPVAGTGSAEVRIALRPATVAAPGAR